MRRIEPFDPKRYVGVHFATATRPPIGPSPRARFDRQDMSIAPDLTEPPNQPTPNAESNFAKFAGPED